MKRLAIALVCIICLAAVPASASLFTENNDNSILKDSDNQLQGQQQGIDSEIESRNTNTNLLGNDQDQDQDQKQGIFGSGNSDNDNENRNTNTNLLGNDQDQGQDQKQAMGQAQGNANKIDINDNSEYRSYAFSPPAIHAQKGTSSANMYSIFGGVGLSQTEEYTIAIEKIAVIERLQVLGYLTPEEARAEARATYAQLDSATQPKRILSVLGKTRGRHLLNLLGLLSWDSFWAEGQVPFKGSAQVKTIDTLETYRGNEGNIDN